MASTRTNPAETGQPELHELVARLALEDINIIESARQGTSTAALTDEEVAFRLQAEEARAVLAHAQNWDTMRYIDDDMDSNEEMEDDDIILEEDDIILNDEPEEAAEHSAPEDREVTRALITERELPSRALAMASGALQSWVSVAGGSALQALQFGLASISRLVYSPDKERVSNNPTKTTGSVNCTVCGDPIRTQIIRAPCGNCSYDVECLRELYTRATTDESLFPPRCCQRLFQLATVRVYLGPAITQAFERKAVEFSTPNRVYCARPQCSAFLGPASTVAHSLHCTACLRATCAACKEEGHWPRPCRATQDAEVLAMGVQEGWKRCPACTTLIELTIGCYHMTCRCRKQFCYLCTATWKECMCPQWEENRLFAAAEVRVQRALDQRQAAPAAPEMRRLVRQEAEQLRVDHECQHQLWRYRQGRGMCESCHHTLPNYLFMCRGCRMLACNRCRRNRL